MAGEAGVDLWRLVRLHRHGNFALYSVGNLVSLSGIWAQRLATGWLAWELTGSSAWLGIIAFADLFPIVLAGPFAGAMADRMDRILILRLCQAGGALLALTVAAFSAMDALTIHILVLLTLVHGIFDAVAQPSRMTLVPSLVPKAELGTAVAFGAVAFNIARFIGPVVAGTLIVTAGVTYAFLVNAATFTFFLIALMIIPRQPPVGTTTKTSVMAEVIDGAVYVARSGAIPYLFLILLAAGLLGRPLIELLPGIAGAVYQTDAAGLATMSASVAVGAMAGGILLASLTSNRGLVRIVGVSVTTMALTVLLLITTTWLWLAIPILVLFGFLNIGAFVATQTLLHLHADIRMRGRVLAVYGMVVRGAPALGALLIGIAAEFLGFRTAIGICAVILTATVVPLWLKLRNHPDMAGGGDPTPPPMDEPNGR